MTRALVTGAGGFIGGHLVRRLLDKGWEVDALDIKPRADWWQTHDDSVVLDLTDAGDTSRFKHPLAEADTIFHLAENMGGIGFIETHRVECASSIVTTVNLLNAVRSDQTVFFSSSACVYPRHSQLEAGADTLELSEWMAIPAEPEAGYGWEKLYAEQLMKYHHEERGVNVRIARFHNSYGTYGSWSDGREKAPAALSRKIAVAKLTGEYDVEIWGDGEQTRTFMYVDDNVDGVLRLHNSGYNQPVNIGTAHVVTINELARLIEAIAFEDQGKIRYHHKLDAPLGVRGRSSDNTLLRSITNGWEPSTSLEIGLETTYRWIEDQVRASLQLS